MLTKSDQTTEICAGSDSSSSVGETKWAPTSNRGAEFFSQKRTQGYTTQGAVHDTQSSRNLKAETPPEKNACCSIF